MLEEYTKLLSKKLKDLEKNTSNNL